MSSRFTGDFRRSFNRGLAAALPTLLTVALLIYAGRLIKIYVGDTIYHAIMRTIAVVWGHWSGHDMLSELHSMPSYWKASIWWIGFLLAIVGIYFFGRFVASMIGRSLYRLSERVLERLPLVKNVYPAAKQLTNFLWREDPHAHFTRVVAVEYPRKGIWSVGLVTGKGMKSLNEAISGDLLTVFIPSSPTPFTGYTITVRRDEALDLPMMTIDEALQFTVTGGVVLPPREIDARDVHRPVLTGDIAARDTRKEIPS